MKKWEESLTEDSGKDFEARVLESMRPLLKQNAEIYAGNLEKKRPSWWYAVVPALALGALAVILIPRNLNRGERIPENLPPEIELALDYDMIRDIHAIENLEILEKLGDSKQWRVKKAKPKSG